ncbi:unnamed protein product [Urochloa decumbens]|uniref:DUF674 family protein n=1 Tax=Urochloa decumbens TaxID=240449 RepID=A0ABC8ZT00_9POAL
MAPATPTTAALSMKILIDTKAQRVLFAEASKEVVDFLFSLLALPVATAVKLLGTDAMVGSVGNLYASVENLESTYVLPGAAKGALLSPTVPSPAASSNSSLLRLPEPPSSGQEQPNTLLYRCRSIGCRSYMLGAYGKAAANKGFVQGIMTYTVTDNLSVTPMSSISSITLLNTFAVTDIAALQEKTVQLGYAECSGSGNNNGKAAKATTADALTMKLLIDTKAQRVLFAEAGKDVVDFLFSLLALPVATSLRLLGEAAMVGSLYASVQRLDDTYC